MFIVKYEYYNQKGVQKTKFIERKTLEGLISAMRKHLENAELFYIDRVSRNLEEYDFSQHGKEFEGKR